MWRSLLLQEHLAGPECLAHGTPAHVSQVEVAHRKLQPTTVAAGTQAEQGALLYAVLMLTLLSCDPVSQNGRYVQAT